MMLSSSTHGRTLGRHGVIEHQKSQQLRSIRAGGLAAVAPRIPCGRRDTPEAGSGAPRCVVARAQSSRIKIVNADELQAMIGQRREKPVIVDFFATWCGPCLLLATELEKVSAELGDGLDIYKLDVDAQDNQALSTSLQIQGLPTMLFISPDDQKPVLRTEGLLPADTIKNIVSKEL